MPIQALLDANVLYPLTLRDTLLRVAAEEFINVYWSAQILEEVSRNLIQKAGITPEQSTHLLSAMNTYFPHAMVTGYESLIASMANDEKDRHVAAAAVKISADIIVTNNLKDFRDLPAGIQAVAPDRFLVVLFQDRPQAAVDIVMQQAEDMRRPPISFEELRQSLAKIVPSFAALIQT